MYSSINPMSDVYDDDVYIDLYTVDNILDLRAGQLFDAVKALDPDREAGKLFTSAWLTLLEWKSASFDDIAHAVCLVHDYVGVTGYVRARDLFMLACLENMLT